MLFWVGLLLHVLFCWPLGSGVAFYSSGCGQHDHLDAVRQTKSNILGRKSVVVASLWPRFALMNETKRSANILWYVYETI